MKREKCMEWGNYRQGWLGRQFGVEGSVCVREVFIKL